MNIRNLIEQHYGSLKRWMLSWTLWNHTSHNALLDILRKLRHTDGLSEADLLLSAPSCFSQRGSVCPLLG